MKKIILLLSAVFVLTGCNAEYNLNIDGTNISEELLINASTNEQSMEIENNEIDYSAFKNETNTFYKKDKYLNNDYYVMKLDYKFKRNEFINSNIINSCYENIIINDTEDNIRLTTSYYNRCFDKYSILQNLTINVTVNNEVVKHNADSVNENIYTWKITRKNYTKKNIQIVMSNNKKTVIVTEKKSSLSSYIKYGIGIVAIGGLGFLGYKFVLPKIKKIKK